MKKEENKELIKMMKGFTKYLQRMDFKMLNYYELDQMEELSNLLGNALKKLKKTKK